MPASRPGWFRPFRNVVALVGVLVAVVASTLMSVDQPLESGTTLGASPLGYTRSLALFIGPVAALGWWFLRHPECGFQKRAFWRTIGILTPLGFGLDLAFANTFFLFPDHAAVLGECVSAQGAPLPWRDASLLCWPARGGVVPVEEFVFYFTGFLVVLLVYVWADEYWLLAYNVPDYRPAAAKMSRLVQFDPIALVVGVALLAAVFALRWLMGWGEQGWPGYAVFLICVSVVPTVGLFRAARAFVNWRAFSFTLFLIVLVSLLWEVTLALPYGWWGYQSDYMTGVFIRAWFGLPAEAVAVWLAVTWTTVVFYEVVKLWQASGASARRAFFGVG